MTTTVVRNGQFITSTSTEQQFIGTVGGPLLMIIVLVSGSIQVTTAGPNDSPVIDSTYSTYSTAGDKILITVDEGDQHLRIKGAGVVNVTY